MNLEDSINLYAGGPGSGCNPAAGTCGRPAGSGSTTSSPMRSRLRPPMTGNNARLYNVLRDGLPHSREELARAMSNPSLLSSYLNGMRRDAPERFGFSVNRVGYERYQLTSPHLNPTAAISSPVITPPSRPGVIPPSTLAPSTRPPFVRTTAPSTIPNVVLPATSGFRPAPGFLTKPGALEAPYNQSNLEENHIAITGSDFSPGRAYNSFVQRFKMTPQDYKDTVLEGTKLTNEQKKNTSVRIRIDSADGVHIRMECSGVFEQSRNFDLDNKTVYHAYWSVDESQQNKGIAKDIFANQMKIYDHLGLKSVSVSANIDVGGYAWAKYGFTPDQGSWDSLRTSARMKNKADQITDPLAKANAKTILSIKEPKAIWLLANMKEPMKDQEGKDTTVGKHLLLRTDWRGSINLDNEDSYQTTRSYIGAKQKAKS